MHGTGEESCHGARVSSRRRRTDEDQGARHVLPVRDPAATGPHVHLEDQSGQRARREAHDRRQPRRDRRGARAVPLPGRARGHASGRTDPRARHPAGRRPGPVRHRADLAGPLRADLHERARHPHAGAAAEAARDGDQRHRHRALGSGGQGDRRPVHALLGGALRSRVPAYVTGFYYRDGERRDDLRREAAMYVEQGYRTVKVKVGGLTPEADAARVGVIRKAVGTDVAIMLDANQGWNLPTAVRAATLCAPHHIFWLEDPMPWYDERRTLERLKAEVDIPIAAGETEYSPFGLRTMLAEGLVDYLIIDSTWAGGLTTWRKAAVMAELYQIPLAAHHDPQIHVHAVAASPTGFILESFADPTRDPLWFELFRERPSIVDGFMALPEAPGLGLALRDETLQKYGEKIG